MNECMNEQCCACLSCFKNNVYVRAYGRTQRLQRSGISIVLTVSAQIRVEFSGGMANKFDLEPEPNFMAAIYTEFCQNVYEGLTQYLALPVSKERMRTSQNSLHVRVIYAQ